MSKPRLCLIEDDQIMGESLCDRFELDGFSTHWFQSAGAALESIQTTTYSAVVSDIRLPDMDGEALFRTLSERATYLPPWIFITGYGSIDRAVALLKLGAADYVTKPFDLDQLVEKLRTLCMDRPASAGKDTDAKLGISSVMRKIEAILPRLALQAHTVLVTGESGVGKEVVAREIHRLNPATSDKPFVAVNCAALTESLLEAELFGHERGAFTGAIRTRHGVFEQAQGGTLFLDEIGDMPLAMQAKLLRVIQERRIMRVGGEIPIPINLRLICATHRDLRKLVEAREFREDLYYRINVIHIRVPPLRERREDILWLVQRFLLDMAGSATVPKRLTPETEQQLLDYSWPGNVRELRHALERACILSDGAIITPNDLVEVADWTAPDLEQFSHSLESYLQQCERRYIVDALTQCGGQIGQTATSLGITRKNLWEKMKKLGIPRQAVPRSQGD